MFVSHSVTSDLKAVDYMTQVAWQSIGDMDDAMQVVGHELQGEKPDLRIELGDFTPAPGDAITQWRGVKPGLGMAVIGTADGAQQGTAPFDNKRDHVDAGRLVVMMVMPPLHGLVPPEIRVGGQPALLVFTQGHGLSL